MNFCKDCAFFLLPEPKSGFTSIKLGQCRRQIQYNPVDGEPTFHDAWDERMALGTCGPDGRHFVQLVQSTHTSHSDIAAEQMQEEQKNG